MGRGHLIEVLPAVDGLPGLIVEDPHSVGVLGVGEDVLVIPRPPLDVLVVAHFFPGGAGVV